MATRTKSGSSGPRTSAAKSATPGPSASTPSGQQSPTRYSRIHEKEELSNLNDRLATYIDKVRSLEVENSRLTREVRTREETVTREVNSVKKLYEAELNEARKLLDDVSKDKTRLELDCKRLYDASEELRGHLEAKSADASRFQAELSLRERELNDLSTKFNQAQSDKKRLAEEVKNLTKKNQKLEPQCAELLKKAEKETLERINAETELTTLREELEFKESVFQQQLMEVRTKKLVEISEIDGRLSQKYEEKMLASLQEIRDEFEIDLEVKNEEVKRLYEEKLRSLESQLARSSQSSSMALDELRSMTKKIDELARKLSQAEAEKDDAVRKTREYEKDLDATKSRYINEFAKYDAEVTRLRQEMASQMQEYQELMEIKVALDMEIAAYRKLLEGEEERLHITPVATPRTPRSAGRGAKRKRTAFEESEESTDVSVSTSASGDIHIVEEDKSGKFIKLQNKGTSAVALTGWTLNRKVDDRSTVYKFTRAVKLEPGATVTVWSADAGHAAEPPAHVVIKKDSWPFGDVQTTSLVTNAGEEVATSESKRVQRSSSSSWSSGQFTSEFRRGAAKPDDKCCVM